MTCLLCGVFGLHGPERNVFAAWDGNVWHSRCWRCRCNIVQGSRGKWVRYDR